MDPETPQNTAILLKLIVELKNELYAIKSKIALAKEKRKIAYDKRKLKTGNTTKMEQDCFNFDDIYESLLDC